MHNVIVYIFEFVGKEFCGTNIKVEQSMWYGKRKEEIGGEANYVSIIWVVVIMLDNLCCLVVYNKLSYI